MKKIIITIICLLIAFPAFAKNEKKFKKHHHHPPGLEKKHKRVSELPPGWQKKLRRGEPLESDFYEIATRVFNTNKRYYPNHKPGTEVLKIDDRFIRIKKDSKEILEIFKIKKDKTYFKIKTNKNYYPKQKSETEPLKIEDRFIRIKKDTKEILKTFGIQTDL